VNNSNTQASKMNEQHTSKLEHSHCSFTDQEIISGLKQKRKLGRFINELIFHYTKKESQVAYVFSTDEFVLNINQEYLQHDTYTDIITFDLSEKKSTLILSDIFISIERVKENAQIFNKKYQEELLRVIIHGALHLSGYKDKTKEQKAEMRNLEEIWIDKYSTYSKINL
jgi:rRNA maturation RNase YbeY